MNNVKVMVGQTWVNNGLEFKPTYKSTNYFCDINSSYSEDYLHDNFTFVPANDLEWLAVNLIEWRGAYEQKAHVDSGIYYVHEDYTGLSFTRQQWHNERVILGLESDPMLTEGGLVDSTLPDGVSREEFDKGMRESMKAVSILVGKQFGIDIGYENLPEAVSSVIDSLVCTIAELTPSDDKPVYTQARFDNDRQPLAGMRAIVSVKGGETFECTVMYLGEITVIADTCDTEHGFPLGNLKFTPIDTRTDEEKLIDEIVDCLSGYSGAQADDNAIDLLSKFNITRK